MVRTIWIPDSETIISSAIFYTKIISTFVVLVMPQPTLFYPKVNLENSDVAVIFQNRNKYPLFITKYETSVILYYIIKYCNI